MATAALDSEAFAFCTNMIPPHTETVSSSCHLYTPVLPQCLIVPLIVSSFITTTAALDFEGFTFCTSMIPPHTQTVSSSCHLYALVLPQCLILPLIVSSLITATAALDKSASGRLGLGAIVYYMTTTLISVIIGIVLVLSIHPGDPNDLSKIERQGLSKDITPLDALLDLIR